MTTLTKQEITEKELELAERYGIEIDLIDFWPYDEEIGMLPWTNYENRDVFLVPVKYADYDIHDVCSWEIIDANTMKRIGKRL